MVLSDLRVYFVQKILNEMSLACRFGFFCPKKSLVS